jgi:hypothetical protein
MMFSTSDIDILNRMLIIRLPQSGFQVASCYPSLAQGSPTPYRFQTILPVTDRYDFNIVHLTDFNILAAGAR